MTSTIERDAQRRLIGLLLTHPNNEAVRDIWRNLVARYPVTEWVTQVHRIIASVISDEAAGGSTTPERIQIGAFKLAKAQEHSIHHVIHEIDAARDVATTPAQAILYTQPLINGRLGRQAHLRLALAVQACEDAAARPLEVLEHLIEDGIRILEDTQRTSGAVPQADAVSQALEEMQAPRQPALRSPWPHLDRMVNAQNPGLACGLHVIAARPKVGKSGMWEQLAEHIGRQGTPSLVVTLEMTKAQHLARMGRRNLEPLRKRRQRAAY